MNASPTPIRHILVPHDFSEAAQRALAYAVELADKLGARLTVMHAYEIPAYGFPEAPLLTTDVVGQIHRAAQVALDGVANRVQHPGREVKTELRNGTAWREINGLAKQLNVDLVVMGTHGRRGLARALLGSVAEKVVRTAPCPVLTIHGPE
jgi:nucleotide-binding universal stress UspA family protein